MSTDTVLINPSIDTVREHISAALARANGCGRARLVTDGEAAHCVAVAMSADDWHQIDGGGVANSYGYRAETTRLGVAAWTDPDGRRHVRIACDRHNIAGRHVSCVLGNARTMETCHPAQRVYPFLRCPDPAYSGRTEAARQDRAFIAAIKSAPANVLPWGMYADWLEDRGHASAANVRAIAARLEKALALAPAETVAV